MFKLFKGGTVTVPTVEAYEGKVPIKMQTLGDVAKIIQYISDDFKGFYQQHFLWATNVQPGHENSE